MTQPNNPLHQYLERISEAERKASSAPWSDDGDAMSWTEEQGYADNWVITPRGQWHGPTVYDADDMCQQRSDATFIALARNEIARLVSMVEQAERALQNACAFEPITKADEVNHYRHCEACAGLMRLSEMASAGMGEK